jgi:hypothetical protein
MTFSRRNFLLASAAAGAAVAMPSLVSRTANAASTPKHLITMFASGGWDTTYVLDPKQGKKGIDGPTDGNVEMFGDMPIYTSTARPSVRKFFEKYASIATIVNGVQVRAINHPDCAKRVLTGTQSETNADMGSITSYELGRDRPAPYLVLGPSAISGPYAAIAARAGSANQIHVLLDPKSDIPRAAPYKGPRYAADDAERDLLNQYVKARAEHEKAIRGLGGYNAERYADFLTSLEHRDVLRGFKDGFGKDFSFTLDVKEQIKLGLDAIQRGVCWSVHIEGTYALWDTHSDNTRQSSLNEDFYSALTSLVDGLASRPGSSGGKTMLDETVIAVMSEMGRTPLLNGQKGKDHWPVTSAMFLGAGVKGGQVIGQSTDELQADNVDLHTGEATSGGVQLQYGNLAAGLLKLTGVDPTHYLPGSEAFDALIG